MTVWFPELRAVLEQKLGPHFPPHPFRILAGAALSALVAGLVLGILVLTCQGLSATWRGVQAVSESLVTALGPPIPPPAAVPTSSLAASKPVLPTAIPAPPIPFPRITDPPIIREAVLPDALPYAESLEAPLADGVNQVDFALVQTISRLGLERSRLEPLYTTRRLSESGPYFFQRIRIHLNGAPAEFMAALAESLETWSDRATLESWSAPGEAVPQKISEKETPPNEKNELHGNKLEGNVVRVAVDGIPTHELFLSPVGSVFIPAPAQGEPLLTVIIDDLGANMTPAKELLDLDLPVTFSIMPHTAHAADVARAAHAAGQEVLIHQPMEPMQAPYIKAGPGALMLAMKPEAMRATLRVNIHKVPHASGLNNHMGSRLTRDANAVRLISDEVSAAGLFVLDSLTHPDSIFYGEARRKGLTAYRRDLFLDDGVSSKSSVLRVLNEAEKMAKKTGQAVVIGHPKPETLAALKEWAHTRDGAVALVPLRYQHPPALKEQILTEDMP